MAALTQLCYINESDAAREQVHMKGRVNQGRRARPALLGPRAPANGEVRPCVACRTTAMGSVRRGLSDLWSVGPMIRTGSICREMTLESESNLGLWKLPKGTTT
jgi:hypothetical protein